MYILNSDLIKKLAKKSKFLKRKSKFTAENFISLCVFSGKHICLDSLGDLCSWLHKHENLKITPSALNDRFCKEGEELLRRFLNKLIVLQSKFLMGNESLLKSKFSSIDICDTTSFKVPENLKEYYEGNGLTGGESVLKINLEYDILTGEFKGYDIFDAGSTEYSTLRSLENRTEKNELKIRDLGYFKLSHLSSIDEAGAFYVTRVKTTTGIYKKENSKYSKVDLSEVAKALTEKETIELADVYLGAKEKLKTRLIVTKLSEENKEKKLESVAKNCKRKKKKVSDLAISSAAINVYATNVPTDMLCKEMIYEVYSLRWQIEIMFKVWKSIFKIHLAKPVKIERFHCHLYGKLISLLISTIIVFRYREKIHIEDNKQISELKCFKIIREYLYDIRQAMILGEFHLLKLFQLISERLLFNGIKSRRKDEKTSNDILLQFSQVI